MWRYDFVHDKCRGGAKLKLLCVNNEFTRQCHTITVAASHGKLRDEYLDLELFCHRVEARCIIENYRLAFNSHRSHSALVYQTPNNFADNWKLKQQSLA